MNATQLVRVGPHDVRVGVPTRVDIFSAEGQLLLGRGSTVYRADNVERLQDSGFKIGASADGAARARQSRLFSALVTSRTG